MVRAENKNRTSARGGIIDDDDIVVEARKDMAANVLLSWTCCVFVLYLLWMMIIL